MSAVWSVLKRMRCERLRIVGSRRSSLEVTRMMTVPGGGSSRRPQIRGRAFR